MTTLGIAIFCLTFGLVEGNQRGWGSPLIVGLFVTSAVMTGAFALTQRYGRYPMLTSASSRTASSWARVSACCCLASE